MNVSVSAHRGALSQHYVTSNTRFVQSVDGLPTFIDHLVARANPICEGRFNRNTSTMEVEKYVAWPCR